MGRVCRAFLFVTAALIFSAGFVACGSSSADDSRPSGPTTTTKPRKVEQQPSYANPGPIEYERKHAWCYVYAAGGPNSVRMVCIPKAEGGPVADEGEPAR